MSRFAFKPQLRVNVYHNNDGKYYLESEAAVVTGGKVVFKSAVPFEAKHLKSLAEAVTKKVKEETFPGVFPEDLLYMDKHIIAIYQPEQWMKLNFKDSLKIESKEYHVPGLIFVLNNHSLSVHAYLDKGRPNDDTKLFKAPFYNMYESGTICMGNNDTRQLSKIGNIHDAIKAAISMFFQSEFSHYIDGERLKKMTLEELYRKRIGVIKKEAYIYENKTLKDQIKGS